MEVTDLDRGRETGTENRVSSCRFRLSIAASESREAVSNSDGAIDLSAGKNVAVQCRQDRGPH